MGEKTRVCTTCEWWEYQYTSKEEVTALVEGSSDAAPKFIEHPMGFCRRYPPVKAPLWTHGGQWCGEHTPRGAEHADA